MADLSYSRRHAGHRYLIDAFRRSLSHIKEHLTGPCLFLLTDPAGVLLSMESSSCLKPEQFPIRPGMSFARERTGVNAISEAMSRKAPVYLPPEKHENPLFRAWHCYALPLDSPSGTIGYLDVSTVNADMRSEMMAIAKLIPAQLLTLYRGSEAEGNAQGERPLSCRQLQVLKLIAQGETVKSIAASLNIKECTVNHHKKMIFSALGVQSSAEAVMIAAKKRLFDYCL